MALAIQFLTAATTARTCPQADEIARLAWRAWAEQQLEDDDAARIAAAVTARKATLRAVRIPAAPRPAPQRQRSKSIERRRRLAASGMLPPAIAASFTTSEAAVLAVVLREIKSKGSCALALDHLAALAGTCRTTARNALATARRLRLIEIKYRPRPGRRSETNVITLLSAELISWARLSRGDRAQKNHHHGKPKVSQGFSDPPSKRIERGRSA